MLTKDQAYDIFQRAKKYASVDEVEVLISGGRSALTRFANNTVTQNVADENYEGWVRVAFDHKTARATTNRLDDEGLKSVVQAAESLTRLQEPDPDLLPMANAQEAGPTAESKRYFDDTAAIDPAQRADMAGQMVGVARRQNLIAAGVAASSEHVDAI